MKKYVKLITLFSSVLLLGACASDTGVNTAAVVPPAKTFSPGKVLLDNNGRHVNAHGAGVIYDNGRYYLFGEHKVCGNLGNKAVVGVHCYSSADLYNWKDEGISLKMDKKAGSDIIIGTVLERPKVVFNKKTGKYVMWMHLEFRKGKTAASTDFDVIAKESNDYKTARCGVAVADKITGPYEYIGSFRPNPKKYPVGEEAVLKQSRAKMEKELPNWRTANFRPDSKTSKYYGHKFLIDFDGGQMARDMTVFVDDDDKAYLVCASEENATIHINELTDDYLGFTGKFKRVHPDMYNEAPAIFKKGGKYFMFSSHCTGWAPNPFRVSVADSMMGEWKYLGDRTRGLNASESNYRIRTKLNEQAKIDNVPQQTADTFKTQSTAVIKVEGRKDAFIYLGDRWTPRDALDGRYVFLPVEWEDGLPVIRWYNEWDLSFFDKPAKK